MEILEQLAILIAKAASWDGLFLFLQEEQEKTLKGFVSDGDRSSESLKGFLSSVMKVNDYSLEAMKRNLYLVGQCISENSGYNPCEDISDRESEEGDNVATWTAS